MITEILESANLNMQRIEQLLGDQPATFLDMLPKVTDQSPHGSGYFDGIGNKKTSSDHAILGNDNYSLSRPCLNYLPTYFTPESRRNQFSFRSHHRAIFRIMKMKISEALRRRKATSSSGLP